MRPAIALALLVVSSPAFAEPKVAAGISAGLFHNKEDAAAGIDSTRTLGLWGRAGLSKRVSVQLEVTRHESQEGCASCTFGTATDIRVFSGLVIVDLKDSGRWIPTLMAGMGIDRDDGSFPQQGHHIEGGVGLEYRADGGLTFGIDGRLGGRSIDNDDVILEDTGSIRVFGPTMMREGEYRTIRLTLGVRFQ